MSSLEELRSAVSWSDFTDSYVRVLNIRVRVLTLNLIGTTRVNWTAASDCAGFGAANREGWIEPEHVRCLVIPQTHNKDNSTAKSIRHTLHSALFSVVIVFTVDFFLDWAHFISNRIVLLSLVWKLGRRMGDKLTILYEGSLYFNDVRVYRTVCSYKLGDYCEWPSWINCEIWTRSEEAGWARSVRVGITTVFVAWAFVTLRAITTSGTIAASELTWVLAWVEGESRWNWVSFPNIHFCAASSHLSSCGRGIPTFHVCFSVYEFDIVGTLGVTVTCTVSSASAIVALAFATVLAHLNEVKSAIYTTR